MLRRYLKAADLLEFRWLKKMEGLVDLLLISLQVLHHITTQASGLQCVL